MIKTRKILIMVVIVTVLLSVAAIAMPQVTVPLTAETHPNAWATSDRMITPEYSGGNNDESTFASTYFHKEDSPAVGSGTYPLGEGRSLTVVIGEGPHGPCVTSWTAVGIKVMYFVVKGGPGFFAYDYRPTDFMDDGHLYPPINDGTQHPEISHFSIYYEPDEPEETTTIELTTESLPLESETTERETTQPSGETVTETTLPMTTAEETTQPSGETISETTTIILTTPDIPQTGESGSGNDLLIGLVLLLMAGGLTLVVLRSKKA
jgi:LPXTG-motif cell wall-anchored protein